MTLHFIGFAGGALPTELALGRAAGTTREGGNGNLGDELAVTYGYDVESPLVSVSPLSSGGSGVTVGYGLR